MGKEKLQINNERLAEKIVKKRNELAEMEKWSKILVKSVNKYLELLEPILKKRGIKIKSTQMYWASMKKNAALAHIDFEEHYGGYESKKVKNLEKEIRDVGIPCPIGSPYRGVTITIYEEVLFDKRMKEIKAKIKEQ